MQLEDYFDFNTEPVEHIRIKGTRIDIAFVIELYSRHMTPEQIAVHFGCPITVEQAYATITYYLHNKAAVDDYLERGEENARRAVAEYRASRTPEQRERDDALRTRLRDLKARFTDEHGRLNAAALKEHLARETPVAEATA